ncbi:hypothetical protein HY502_00020 [Candidatus Woesebacteria bacterium]|nr:hypothetical protein [Candidatus Woesebacteria bacterium]
MKNKGFAPIIILVILALAVGGYLAYRGGYLDGLKSEPSLSPLTTLTSGTATEDWETYSDKDWNISFKYPSDFQVDGAKHPGIEVFWDGEYGKSQRWLYVFYNGVGIEETYLEWLKLRVEETKKFRGGGTVYEETITRLPNTKVAGVDSFVFESPDVWEAPSVVRYVVVPRDNKYFLILMTYSNLEGRSIDYPETFDQILSTFKLTK